MHYSYGLKPLWPQILCTVALLSVSPTASGQNFTSIQHRPSLLTLLQSDDEPAAPSTGAETTKNVSPSTDEPTSQQEKNMPQGKDEPNAKGEGEPGGARSSEGEPPIPETTISRKSRSGVEYGLGFQFRGIFVPSWFLNAFLNTSTPLNSVAMGGEFVRRKGNFDLVGSINFGFYSPEDGNYMAKNKSYERDVDYIQFRDLNLLAFDVAFIWHHDFNPWISLVYGAGLGFGVVLGDIYRISNSGCTPENVGDTSQCYPRGMDRAHQEEWLTQNTCTGPDSPENPCLYREEGVWPVVPIVHLLLGVNFKINDQMSLRVDTGFHDAFYFGATGHYFF